MTDTKKAMAAIKKKLEEKGWDKVYGEGAMIVPDVVKPPKKEKGKPREPRSKKC